MTKAENPTENQIDNTPEDKARPDSESDSQLEFLAESYLNLWQDNIKHWATSPNPPGKNR